ncbi:toll/interleukin-1 receptor domain-containing protein [Sorangium sp. So ce327]|uniref:toll/interleukin-1 receptor domain-containing protein n=1 Tax=Sorangium sp. So ce327 TaxID=3133301 RepID=UPI003F5E3141
MTNAAFSRKVVRGAWFGYPDAFKEFLAAAENAGKNYEVQLYQHHDAYDSQLMLAVSLMDFVVLPLSLPNFGSLWFVDQIANKTGSRARLILRSQTDADPAALSSLFDGVIRPEQELLSILDIIERPSSRERASHKTRRLIERVLATSSHMRLMNGGEVPSISLVQRKPEVPCTPARRPSPLPPPPPYYDRRVVPPRVLASSPGQPVNAGSTADVSASIHFEAVTIAPQAAIPPQKESERATAVDISLTDCGQRPITAVRKKNIEVMDQISVFFSYSHKDEVLRDELATHLKLLERAGVIRSWYDRRIEAGEDWKAAIDSNLEEAQMILLLVSADFLASDYCYDIEMKRALARHDAGEAMVIPIILRECKWSRAPFAKLQALPKDARPVTSWANRDEAWTNVASGIESAAGRIVGP